MTHIHFAITATPDHVLYTYTQQFAISDSICYFILKNDTSHFLFIYSYYTFNVAESQQNFIYYIVII